MGEKDSIGNDEDERRESFVVRDGHAYGYRQYRSLREFAQGNHAAMASTII
jgi:hypothetical protein